MNDRRGLVVKRTRNRVTAITKSGEFVTWKDRRDLMPGEEVIVPSPRFQGFVWQRLVPATALAAVLIFLSFFGYRHYLYARPVLAYVTFDSSGEVAGSVELEVNDRGLVKKAVALDEAGAQALSGLRVEMQPVQTVLTELRRAMPNGGKVVVAFIPVTEPKADSQPEPGESGKKSGQSSLIADLAKKVFDSVGEATAVVLDMETRAVAHELGLSAGRAASWAMWDLESATLLSPPDDPGTEPVTEPSDPEPVAEPLHIQEPGSQGDPAGSNEPVSSGNPLPGSSGAGSEPHAGTKPAHSGNPGEPSTPGQSGGTGKPDNHIPPGQQKKYDAESYLDMIRKNLPELELEKDSKKSIKELEKLTKDWLKTLKEMSKESHKESGDKHKEGDQGDGPAVPQGTKEPGKPSNDPSGDKGSGNNSGKGEDKPGKPESEGKDKGNQQGGKGDKDDKDDKNDKDHRSPGPSNKNLPGKDENNEPGKKGSTGKTDDGGKVDSSGEHTGLWYTGDKGSSLTDRLKWTREFLEKLWR